jgi:hypothetical protein
MKDSVPGGKALIVEANVGFGHEININQRDSFNNRSIRLRNLTIFYSIEEDDRNAMVRSNSSHHHCF